MTTQAGHTVAPSQPGLLPPAVRAQVDAANALVSQLNAPPGAAAAPAPPAQRPQPTHAAPPPDPALLSQHQAPPNEPAPDINEQLRVANARFATLQGKYNSETHLLRQQNEQQSALVQQLLERAPPAPAAAPAPVVQQTPEEQMRALGASDKDIEEYGDLLPLVARMANNMVRPTLAKLESELAKVQQGQGKSAAELQRQQQLAFYSTLDSTVPGWRAVNESEHFLEWLNVHDIFAGVTRRVALTTAYNSLDAARVSGMFQAYAREYPQQARTPGAAQVDPATLLAPDTRGGNAPAPEGSVGGKRTWSESEITDFYAKVRKKLVSPEEYKRMMVEISQASAEGRIVPTRRIHLSNGQ